MREYFKDKFSEEDFRRLEEIFGNDVDARLERELQMRELAHEINILTRLTEDAQKSIATLSAEVRAMCKKHTETCLPQIRTNQAQLATHSKIIWTVSTILILGTIAVIWKGLLAG